MNPTYDDIVWECIRHNKFGDRKVYDDPNAWLHVTHSFLNRHDYSQFVTNHSDGRILLVTYEKILGLGHWWYQARLDITKEVKFQVGGDCLLGPGNWAGGFSPLSRNTILLLSDYLESAISATALISSRGSVIEANRAFLEILGRGDGLLYLNGRLSVRNPDERVELQRRMNRFFLAGSKAGPNAMRVSRYLNDSGLCDEQETTPYLISLTPLFPSARKPWNVEDQVGLLTVVDPEVLPVINPRLLVEFYKLSNAEAHVASLLGAGRTVEEIAAIRSTSVHTIYCQVKSIIGKTGFKGQTDIARRVSALACLFASQKNVLSR
jgi:DNA-binding CsgD family transcriptional regulator/PAS domain-containing protein